MSSLHPALLGGPVYLDYNATTPVDPRVVEAMLPHLGGHFGNPSSAHAYAAAPAAALHTARAQDLATAITPQTVLVSVMLANNETGTLQPVAALADIAHRHGVLVHSDAAQAAGKIPLDVAELGVDLPGRARARAGVVEVPASPGRPLAPAPDRCGRRGPPRRAVAVRCRVRPATAAPRSRRGDRRSRDGTA
jgi:hypothetical protein